MISQFSEESILILIISIIVIVITKNLNIQKTIKNYSSKTLKNRFLKNKKNKICHKKVNRKKTTNPPIFDKKNRVNLQ